METKEIIEVISHLLERYETAFPGSINEVVKVDDIINSIEAYGKIQCPLCQEKCMTLRDVKGNGIWSCSECPAILLEYYDNSDLDKLTTYLSKS